MVSNGPVAPVVGNGGQLCSGISGFNELVHFESDLIKLGLVYLVIACMSLCDKMIKFDLKRYIMVHYFLYCRDMID